MRNFKLALGAVIVAAGFASCKDEAKMTAEKHVDHYVVFVDSVNSLDAQERAANWAAIQAEYEMRTAEAEAALATLENEAKAQERITESKSKYEGVKTQAESEAKAKMEAEATPAPAGTGSLADAFFGPGVVVGNDMKFAWVNKDNILSVYQKFVDTFNANKDNYSRQDFDKIKAYYEALDTRKNTVEKEGLSGEDNRKIAALKLGFAPKFKWERMTAKSDENAKAKE
ncbi:hypothetical protein [Flavobacterium subsaxonicum]|uniref:Lipoprotein n=1 Tax=Flavobacterium subsaxonicum WB 4.1-42 = DSM 21790 TaxID=1121898 RepID=A0A0A2MIG7_9FLAO|nr:hypothetical protein [Flavobacterium subsaxonicum]KGO92437.1 hypothetical protein Q766_13345 [Flavobacterium subsaxonicum WB 4.1-42 = DSM 21790]